MRRIVLVITMITLQVTAESGRFSRSDEGIVTDHKTGLQWQDDYNNNNEEIKTAKWIDAIDYCKNLMLGSSNDWRLPNIRELLSIVDHSRYDPAIDPIFQYTVSDYYWSSTTYVGYTGAAWDVWFYYGYSNGWNKDDNHYVRCVRGGE